jgi:hypothetical protein
MWEEAVLALFMVVYYPGVCLDRLKKTAESLRLVGLGAKV